MFTLVIIGLVVLLVTVLSIVGMVKASGAKDEEPIKMLANAILVVVVAYATACLLIGSFWGFVFTIVWFISMPFLAWALFDIGLIWASVFGASMFFVSLFLWAAVPAINKTTIALCVGVLVGFGVVAINDLEAKRLIWKNAASHGLTIQSIKRFSSGYSDRYGRQATATKGDCLYYWIYSRSEWRSDDRRDCPSLR